MLGMPRPTENNLCLCIRSRTSHSFIFARTTHPAKAKRILDTHGWFCSLQRVQPMLHDTKPHLISIDLPHVGRNPDSEVTSLRLARRASTGARDLPPGTSQVHLTYRVEVLAPKGFHSSRAVLALLTWGQGDDAPAGSRRALCEIPTMYQSKLSVSGQSRRLLLPVVDDPGFWARLIVAAALTT